MSSQLRHSPIFLIVVAVKKYDLYTRQVIKTKFSFFIRDKYHKVNTGFIVKESYLFFTQTVFINALNFIRSIRIIW